MKIELLNCDCMELMEETSDNYYELSIVDPPYGIPDAFKGGFASSRTKGKQSPFARNMTHKTWNESAPKKEYFENVMKVSVNQIIWGGNYFIDYLYSTRGIIGWVKPQMANGDHPFFSHFELAWTSFRKPAKIYQRVTVESKIKRIHSTQKPIALYHWLLNNYAKKGDKIIDTHGGSMSIAIACIDLGFDLTLCELDKDYFNAGVNRIKKYLSQSDMFRNEIELIIN